MPPRPEGRRPHLPAPASPAPSRRPVPRKAGYPPGRLWGECDRELGKLRPVPERYPAREGGPIPGGRGVIENDLHDNPELRPGVCAAFEGPGYRNRGIVRQFPALPLPRVPWPGYRTLCLLTDCDRFCGRCGWGILLLCPGGGGTPSRLYRHDWQEKRIQ